MPPTIPWKGELEKIFFQTESTFGVYAGGTWRRFGITHGATLPDLENLYDPQWWIGEGRNWQLMPKARQEYRGGIPNLWILNGQFLKFIWGQVVTTGSSPYTHTISETSQLPSFSIDALNYDAAGNLDLIRRFLGCKVNRATFEAREGEPVVLNIDEIQAKKLIHNQSGVRGYDGSVVTHDVSILTTQPYFFFEGDITLAGVVLARIRNFRLEINNNNEAPYYVTRDAAGDQPVIYSIDEGRRNYRFTCTYDIDDVTLFKECMKAGPMTAGYYGASINLKFLRANSANDYIEFQMPYPATPSSTNPGCFIRSNPIGQVETPLIPVELVAEVPSMQVVVKDSLDSSAYA
jgi:hypothetical protein